MSVLHVEEAKMRYVAVISLLAVSAACTWVKPKDGAEGVALVKPGLVSGCTKAGSVNVSTAKTVAGLRRKQDTVRDELLALAKNEALSLGADTLVSLTEIDAGKQTFEAYKCHTRH